MLLNYIRKSNMGRNVIMRAVFIQVIDNCPCHPFIHLAKILIIYYMASIVLDTVMTAMSKNKVSAFVKFIFLLEGEVDSKVITIERDKEYRR